ncbi:unnamed protein product [Rhizophagus irregularis]|uniref:Uncharacterized protein n=1 Tax=Rhizophagus irregularis TaxID=588596 RepID=A0A2N1N0M5_9GLOM|nr:hypothetical protein RhiirC2_783554 [Rhizophagus irregularis]CAB5365439.1 unnamed protein product [Rhizophagus irregularis]
MSSFTRILVARFPPKRLTSPSPLTRNNNSISSHRFNLIHNDYLFGTIRREPFSPHTILPKVLSVILPHCNRNFTLTKSIGENTFSSFNIFPSSQTFSSHTNLLKTPSVILPQCTSNFKSIGKISFSSFNDFPSSQLVYNNHLLDAIKMKTPSVILPYSQSTRTSISESIGKYTFNAFKESNAILSQKFKSPVILNFQQTRSIYKAIEKGLYNYFERPDQTAAQLIISQNDKMIKLFDKILINSDMLDKKLNDWNKEKKEIFADWEKEILSTLIQEIIDIFENKYQKMSNEMATLNSIIKDKDKLITQKENLLNVRGTLEFVRAQILAKSKSISFHEPYDKALKLLSQDKTFIDNVERACRQNCLRYDDVQRSMGGLYHHASTYFHGHEKPIIDQRIWSKTEVFIIGVIFDYYKISFDYCNEQGEIFDYPYDLRY